jgi:hypothetical protein
MADRADAKTTSLIRRAIVALFATVCLGGCIIESDSPHRQCPEGAFECSADDTVDVCDHGRWVVYDDCWDLCNGPGFCDYDVYDEPVCFCD